MRTVLLNTAIAVKNNADIVLACIISATLFLLVFGAEILNPYYQDWLLTGGDISLGYIPWLFYLHSPWQFPLGVIDDLFYPYQVGISQVDALPIFALIFKLFSFLFNGDFQYVGLFAFTAFLLQAVFGILILRKATESFILRIIGVLFVIFAPIMLYRTIYHTALSSHWLILAGLYLALSKYEDAAVRWEIGKWSLLMVLAILIMPYFVIMLVIILSFTILAGFRTDRKTVFRSAALFIVPCAAGVTAIKIIGALSDAAQAPRFLQWENSFNFNAFFNPLGWSAVLGDLKHAGPYQYEGFAYLGLGVILILTAAFALTVTQWVKNRESVKTVFNKFTLLVLGLFLTSVLCSTGGLFSFGDHVFFLWHIPYIKFINFFRSTGRFIWIAVYILTFFALFKLIKFPKKQILISFLILCAAIQIRDVKGQLIEKHNIIRKTPVVNIEKFSSLRQSLGDNFKHIIFFGYTNAINQDQLYNIAYFAAKNRLTINDYYSDRKPPARTNQYIAYQIDKYTKGEPEDDNLYVINNLYLDKLDFPVYMVDDLFFSSATPLDGLNPISFEEYPWKLPENILPKNNRFLRRGADIEEGRVLAPGGVSFGPRLALPAGAYRIDIKGQNLGRIRYGAMSATNNNIRHSLIEHTEQGVSYIALLQTVPDAEFIVINDAGENLLISSITVNKAE
jgi:hypothetical protein